MTTETLLIEARDGILVVTVNRPEALNALSKAVLTELKQVLATVAGDRDPAVRGIVLTGAGERAFIAGADIREMAAMDPDEGEAFGRLGQEVTELFERVQVPVIACVNGFALGGGCEMAMACDFIYCTDNAVFGQPEVSLGLIPGFGGCVRLQRFIGPGRAKELIYSGRRVDAIEAVQIGLANQAFATSAEMLDAARHTLDQIGRNSPVAVSVCKATINAAMGQPTADALAIEANAFRTAFTTADMRAGTQAFLAKRAPEFPGFAVARTNDQDAPS